MGNKNLYQQLLDPNTLLRAWKIVKAKNSAGGVDGVSLLEFERNLSQNINTLSEDLARHQWQPLPYKQIEIPKKDGEIRRLGMLSIRDKIVQNAIKMLIEPRCERLFLGCSYGFRPQKGAVKAIRRTLFECSKNTFKVALRLDIDNFFDNVDHDILRLRLSAIIGNAEIVRLILLIVKMGCITPSGRWAEPDMGVPQGAVLSPILANIYLHSFDQFVLSRTKAYIRYADDFLIFCENEEAAIGLCNEITNHLQTRLKLSLNPSVITNIDTDGVEFLGLWIKRHCLTLSDAKLQELKSRISMFEFSEKGLVGRSLKSWDGLVNYYGKLLDDSLLSQLDGAFVARIKQVITADYRLFPSKTSLANLLITIPWLSADYSARKKQIISELVDAYVVAKGETKLDDAESQNRKIIQARKLEFRRKEVEGSELIVSRPGTFIGLSSRGVTVKEKGNIISQIPTTNLSHIIIAGRGVSMSSNILDFCMANKIPVDFFDNSGTHIGSFLSARYMENSLWHKQSIASDETSFSLALSIIKGKLKNQFGLIKYFHKYHKNKLEALDACYDDVDKCYSQFEEFAKASPNINAMSQLIGHEAQMAIRYWNYIRQMLADDNVGFERRIHRGAKDVVNSMLNYGYSILYARVWQALLAVGLNPYSSVIHVRHSGRPTFVYDVIEIFRSQVVDRVVISLVQKGPACEVANGLLSDATRRILAKSVVERLNRYEKYRGSELKLAEIIQAQASEIAEFYESGKKYKPYVSKW